jgi:hypothetical protein
MKKTYIATIARDEPGYQELLDAGLTPQNGIQFVLDSQDERWASLERIFRADPDCFRVDCRFTRREILAADWTMISLRKRGYPQPEDTYLTSTYRSIGRCSDCGVGRSQVAPFKVRSKYFRESDVCCTLEWIHDVAIVPSSIFHEHAAPFQIASRPLLDFRTAAPLTDWCQMVPQAVVDFAASPPATELLASRCLTCGANKWRMSPGSAIAEPASPPGWAAFVQSSDWFGEGAFAFQPLLIRRDLARILIDLGIDYSRWIPSQSVPS